MNGLPVLLTFFRGRRARQAVALMASGMTVLLMAAPAVLASPDVPDPAAQQAIVESMPDYLPEIAFVLLSTTAMFVIYLRSRVQRIRKMHEIQ